MAIKSEQRLSSIENKIKELKATYTIYGGMIKSYQSVSPIYETEGRAEVVIRFTPDFMQSEIILSSIYYELIYGITGERVNFTNYVYIEPQDSENYVNIRIPVFVGTVRISVVGTSPGTFTRVA